MNIIDQNTLNFFLDEKFEEYYNNKVTILTKIKFEDLFSDNPYLFSLGNYYKDANTIVSEWINKYIEDSDKFLFEDFILNLAVFVAEMTCGGHKSTATGIDLEFSNKDIYYVVSVKSGPNWGNSSQQRKLEQDFINAVTRIRQSRRGINVQPVLGICYGKTKTSYLRGYMKVVGQNFWYLISEDCDLYTEIVEPIGHRAKEHNEKFLLEKSRTINLFTKEFIVQYCEENGQIDWKKLIEFNSGNFDLDQYMP
jgi:hypothetical protein